MSRTVVVAGVGPGLGGSVAERFAEEGCRVALFARTESYIDDLASRLNEGSGEALAVQTDLAAPESIEAGFERVREAFGPVDVLVNNASAGSWKGLRDLSREEFEQALNVNARGAFLCSKEAVTDMLADDSDETEGTVIFTGATSATRGRSGALGFSAAKFAARGMAESMARELGPRGVHVAHVVIDGGILPPRQHVESPEAYLDPDAIAESYWHLVEQERSAWTLELDLRPHVEEF
jgi:NAD(P)-dependent dehydrogenase (short-subunit alcohol dehydrogenase family)